jgi:hypothetical protein
MANLRRGYCCFCPKYYNDFKGGDIVKFESLNDKIKISGGGITLLLRAEYLLPGGGWAAASFTSGGEALRARADGIDIALEPDLKESGENSLPYAVSFTSDFDTRLRLRLELPGEKDYFHLIPANIYGDNNVKMAKTDEYPILTEEYGDSPFCSPYWEFRADRAPQPVSMLCCRKGAAGISIDPYSPLDGGHLRNGVFSALPDSFGVTLGYANTPYTYINKRELDKPRCDLSRGAKARGCIYAFSGNGRRDAHRIIREVYSAYHQEPEYKKSFAEAAKALTDTFINLNWSELVCNYCNLRCKIPEDNQLKPWRQLPEIGWTAGGVIGYPFALSEYVLGLGEGYFGDRKDAAKIFDEICGCYNGRSGMFNDVTVPNWRVGHEPSPVNGWWSDFGLAKDCHCAYTNGSAVAYMLRTLRFLKKYRGTTNEKWLEAALKVLDTVLALQRGDGVYGYTFSTAEKKVLDWNGFAGCWFAEGMAYAYEFTGEEKYLASARRALEYYHGFVKDLFCWGTPMDTWKSVDEEGNLAFIRSSRVMHEITHDDTYLAMLKDGAEYEYLWKYCFNVIQDRPPLKDSPFCSCGGSVTSVSNPHIHTMGALVYSDLVYLADITGDSYHRSRAADTIGYIMNTMELYPDWTGYGRYGVLTERFCASDGLNVERYGDGTPASMWFSYNGWAAAAALEAVCERLLMEKSGASGCRGGHGR